MHSSWKITGTKALELGVAQEWGKPLILKKILKFVKQKLKELSFLSNS